MRKFVSLIAALSAFVFSVPVLAQLTPGSPIATGTAVSLTPAIVTKSQNFARSSGDFSTTDWTTTAGLTVATVSQSYSLERGTTITRLTSTGSAESISQPISLLSTVANETGVVSAYFSAFQGGALITNASTNVQMSLLYTGGATATYSVNFNPATGQILSSSGTGVTISIQPFAVPDPFVPGAINVWYRVGLGTKNVTGGLSNRTMTIKPLANVASGTGAVLAYGAQVEITPTPAGTGYTAATRITAQPSALIVTPAYFSAGPNFDRLPGALPRQSIINTRLVYSNTFPTNPTYTSALNGTLLYLVPGGATNSLIFDANQNIQNGETLMIWNPVTAGIANFTVQGSGGAFIALPDGTNSTSVSIPRGTVMTFVRGNGTFWYQVDSFAGTSAVVPAAGGAGTILRSNGTSWAVSQDTWPDLIASGNVLFATAANTVGSSNGFTFAGSVLTIPGGITATGAINFTGTNQVTMIGTAGTGTEASSISMDGGTGTGGGGVIQFNKNAGLQGAVGMASRLLGGTTSNMVYYAASGNGHNWYTNGNVTVGSPNMSLSSAGVLSLPNQPAATGVRYLCIDTAGVIVSQAAACVGT